MDSYSIFLAFTTLAGVIWALFIRGDLLGKLELKDKKLNAIVSAARTEAIATDYYIRSMADGKLTIEEGDLFKKYAAEAIVSHLTVLEEITGKQIYNRPEVPLPLPVGGARPVTISDQPVQQ